MEEVKVQVERAANGFIVRHPDKTVHLTQSTNAANEWLLDIVDRTFPQHTLGELDNMPVGKVKTFTFTLS